MARNVLSAIHVERLMHDGVVNISEHADGDRRGVRINQKGTRKARPRRDLSDAALGSASALAVGMPPPQKKKRKEKKKGPALMLSRIHVEKIM